MAAMTSRCDQRSSLGVRARHSLVVPAASFALLAVACVGAPATAPGAATMAVRAAGAIRPAIGPAKLSGTAIGPEGIAGGNIISSNAGRLGPAPLTLQALSQRPISNAIVYLTDAEERFFASDGKPIMAATDVRGRYAFVSGVPLNEVVVVNVILADNRREVGFTVSRAGQNVVDVSLATTYVTEFLRLRAAAAGKPMAAYDLSRLPGLTRLTERALETGDLAAPDLSIGAIAATNQAYALAVGLNKQGLGDAWAAMLGERVLAVTTVAGNGESGFGGNGTPAVQAQLYKPKGVARDAQGNLYIADEGNHAIRKVSPTGIITSLAGKGVPQFSGDGGPSTEAGLWWPRTVAFAPGGTLYVADTLNMRIRSIDLGTGTIATVAGAPQQAGGAFLNDFAGDGGPASQARLAGVRGMAVDSVGRLVFADTWDNDGGSWHHIRRIDTNGVITTLVGVDGRHGFNGDGKPGRETMISYVNQVAVDREDNVYFADARNHRVRRYDLDTGLVTTVAGTGQDGTKGDGGPATQAELSSPYGVALDARGRLYISERGSRRIRLVNLDGTIRTLAGGGTFTGDGEARSVALVEPHDVFVEPDGNLLVCDSRAARVRRLWLQWGI
jgi:sugar lactone lactonase YvrE